MVEPSREALDEVLQHQRVVRCRDVEELEWPIEGWGGEEELAIQVVVVAHASPLG